MTDRSGEDVRGQLIQLFTRAAASVAARLDALGLSATTEQPRPFVTRNESGGSGTNCRYEACSNLTDVGLLMRASPLLDEQAIESLHQCSAIVADKHAETLPYGFYPGALSSPLTESLNAGRREPPDFSRDPADWTSRVLVQPALLYHLNSVFDVHAVGTAIAEAFAEDVERVAGSESLSFLICVPLSATNLDPASGPVTCGDYELRLLSETEQADWWVGSSEVLWRSRRFLRRSELGARAITRFIHAVTWQTCS